MRGTGTTTQQMMAAPHNAIYVCNGNKDYYKQIAHLLKRHDIQVRGPWVLNDEGILHGTMLTIIIDHDCELTEAQLRTWIFHTHRRLNYESSTGQKDHPRRTGTWGGDSGHS